MKGGLNWKTGVVCAWIALLSVTAGAAVDEVQPATETDARQTWRRLKEKYSDLDRAGYFDAYILDLIRTQHEKEILGALDENPVLREIRSAIQSWIEKDAAFAELYFQKQGFRRLTEKVEPELYQAAMSAIERLGVGTVDPAKIYIFKVNGSGNRNAYMYTSLAGGPMIMVLHDANDQLLTSRLQHKSVAGHEAGHYVANHGRTNFELYLTYYLVGEAMIENDAQRLLKKVRTWESELKTTKEAKARVKTVKSYAPLAERELELTQKIAIERHRITERRGRKLKAFREELGLEAEDIDAILFEKAITEAKRAIGKRSTPTKVIRLFEDVLKVLVPAGKGRASVGDDLISGKLDFDEFDQRMDRYLLTASRAMEETADRAGVIAAGLKPTLETEYLLWGGTKYDGKPPTMEEINAWIEAGLKATREAKEHRLFSDALREMAGTHPDGPERANAERKWFETENYYKSANYFQRLLEFYFSRRQKLSEEKPDDPLGSRKRQLLAELEGEIARFVNEHPTVVDRTGKPEHSAARLQATAAKYGQNAESDIAFRLALREPKPLLEFEKKAPVLPSRGRELLKSTARSAGMFSIQAMGADLLVAGLSGDWERFRTWGSFEELKKIVKGWAGLSVSGAVGESLFKLGYGTSASGEWTGKAAFAGRVIPLWFALTGAELLEHGSVSPSSMMLSVPNVMAAHGVAAAMIRAVRIPMRGLKTAMSTPISAPEMVAMGILEFSLIQGLSKVETWAMEEWNRREMVEGIVANVAQFHRVSLSDRVDSRYANKRVEWQDSYRKLVMSLGMYGDRERLKAEAAKAYELSELSKDDSLALNERKAKEYEIFRKYEEESRRWMAQEDNATPLGDVKIPFPRGGDPKRYEADLENTLSRSLQESEHSFALTQQVIGQTLQAMDQRWREDSLDLAASNTYSGERGN